MASGGRDGRGREQAGEPRRAREHECIGAAATDELHAHGEPGRAGHSRHRDRGEPEQRPQAGETRIAGGAQTRGRLAVGGEREHHVGVAEQVVARGARGDRTREHAVVVVGIDRLALLEDALQGRQIGRGASSTPRRASARLRTTSRPVVRGETVERRRQRRVADARARVRGGPRGVLDRITRVARRLEPVVGAYERHDGAARGCAGGRPVNATRTRSSTATSRASQPTVSSDGATSFTPAVVMLPKVGLKPKMPQKLAGRMTEPAVCVPSATSTMPVATAAADPLDEPPGVCVTRCGLVVGPGSNTANSVVTVLPSATAPAVRSCATTPASPRGWCPA